MFLLSVAGFSEWGDEDDVLARVIAQSQHEYLANLKRNASTNQQPPADDNGSTSADPLDSSEPTSKDKGKSIMPKDCRH